MPDEGARCRREGGVASWACRIRHPWDRARAHTGRVGRGGRMVAALGAWLVAGCAGGARGAATAHRATGADAPTATPVSRTTGPERPLIIAHRGASGHRPEHTLAAYDLAIAMGADFVEPDVVMTKDHALVARHENEIGGTTDVAAKFPERRRTRMIDGDTVTGWFTEDFTLAELKTLRARERLTQRSRAWDGQFEVPTLDEVLALVRRREREAARPIGVYPETKHPGYFRSIGLPLEDSLLAVLARHGFRGRDDAVFIQSFEVGNLQALRARTTIRLVQLVNLDGAPPDVAAAGGTLRYGDMVTAEGLRGVARYADAVGAHKWLVLPRAAAGDTARATTLVRDAHAAGLQVHVWTMRSDTRDLAPGFRGDAAAEWRAFAAAGVDGIFGDFPDVGWGALRGR
ncbi:MAG TPA: glycerophosphodiester phosphodiesterase [Gemmatimonadaceae bacterium]|nr:glycerophosphodiester phosphodiesterase [Gemmatimonadaceae bacterium]